MKYDSGMTHLNKDILAAVRLMCRNSVAEMSKKFFLNDGPPAPVTLRDYLKGKYGKTHYNMHSGNVHFNCNSNNMGIDFSPKSIAYSGETVLTMTWMQVTKFIIDNWDEIFRKEPPEKQPSPTTEDPAETDKPKPTYKDVLLEHYPNFDISRFDEFANNVCVACYFKDDNCECSFSKGYCKKHWESECLFEWRDDLDPRDLDDIEEFLIPADKKEETDNVPDTKTADLPNPPVPANVEETPALFDYSELDGDTAQNLRECENVIRQKTAGYFTLLGEKFKEAQELLANHSSGTFEKWYTALGFKRQTVYNLIQRYDFLSSPTLEGREDTFEALPLTLSYEVSKPDAPKELVERVIDGDITTNAEYIKLKKELEATLERSKAAQSEYENLHSRHYEDLEKWSAETSELKQRINELENRPLEAEVEKYKQQLDEANRRADFSHKEFLEQSDFATKLAEENFKLEQQLENRPIEVMVQQDESVLKELEQLREENARLKDKNIKNMIIRLTIADLGDIVNALRGEPRLQNIIKHAEILKL